MGSIDYHRDTRHFSWCGFILINLVLFSQVCAMQFDTIKLATVLDELLHSSIRYEMRGMVGKVKPLTKSVSEISQLDCSGFVEYVIYQGTTDNVNLPSGSVTQRTRIARDASHTPADYLKEAELRDDIVRIGFRDTVPKRDEDGSILRDTNGNALKEQVGHVWLVINGMTYESTSKGGRARGPKSLKWDERKDDADHFFKLGAAPGFGLATLGLIGHRFGSRASQAVLSLF
jgi:hypothetical protein